MHEKKPQFNYTSKYSDIYWGKKKKPYGMAIIEVTDMGKYKLEFENLDDFEREYILKDLAEHFGYELVSKGNTNLDALVRLHQSK